MSTKISEGGEFGLQNYVISGLHEVWLVITRGVVGTQFEERFRLNSWMQIYSPKIESLQ